LREAARLVILPSMKTWHLLSPRAPHELEALADGCNRAVDALRAERKGEACGQARVGADVPTSGQIAAAYRASGLPVTDRLLARLQSCTSAIVVENPADPQRSALQASALRYLLDNLGGGLVLLDGFPLRTPEEAARELLTGTRSLRGFAVQALAGAVPEEPEDDEGDPRIDAFLEEVEAAEDDPDLALDLRKLLQFSSPVARRCAQAIVQQGARSVEALARLLGCDEDEVEEALDELVDD